jgi:hypothetical protein
MQEGRQAIERRTLILNAVDTFLRIHDEWEADVHGPPQPDEKFERAVHLCIEICERGDTPADCRALIGAVAKMGTEWLLYENGKMGSDHRPTTAFWNAVRDVKRERAGAVPFTPRTRESVMTLRKQGVGDPQIARCNYGDPDWPNGYGPFLGLRGEVNEAALDAEARANEKGESTLPPDWIHPDDRNRKKQSEADAATRLAALQHELQAREASAEDPEKLLREGQFANVVARVCNMPLDEVIALANKIGVSVETTPNLAAQRAPQEPVINEALGRAMDAGTPDGPAFEMPEPETPEAQVARMFEQGFDKEQIAERLGLTPRKVEKLRMLSRV